MSAVSAADPVSFTSDQVINATDSILSYVDANNTLPVDLNISGSVVDMPQFLELLTTVILNINSTSNDLINLGIYGNATNSSENITNSNINSTEYLDIAKRVKDFMDSKGRAPNYATQTSTGNSIGFESLVYMYSNILNSYKTNHVLPENVNLTSWYCVSNKINCTNLLGYTSYGYVEKEVYGNQSSNQTIVLIVGLHPQENGIHTAIANALLNQTLNLTKRYVIYKIHVTQDADDYSKGRMNGQLLGQQFIVPDVPKENPILTLDIHENHYLDSGYDYARFLYPISNTSITTTYANQIISQMPFLVIYTPPDPTSPEYVTMPIAKYGIPTIIYETYMYDNLTKKDSDANAFINAVDTLVYNNKTVDPVKDINLTATVNCKTGLYNIDKNIVLKMNANGTIYYTLNNTTPTNQSKRYNGLFTIKTTTTLKFIAILNGKKSPVYTEKYTIDKIAPKVVSSNTYYSKGFSRTAPISIKFSENIKTSSNWSNIYIKNLNTGKKVGISKSIKNNTLNIKMVSKRFAYNNYQIYIPGGALKDNAGNNLAKTTIIKFKTGKS
ncbi:pseudomurein-binding repeat-containing protein [Methanobacterium lacus]|nr:pseudomurein-binding repeat-containing protein [Methanobacterium lacus]